MIWNSCNAKTNLELLNITDCIEITGDINQMRLNRLDVICRCSIVFLVDRNRVVHSIVQNNLIGTRSVAEIDYDGDIDEHK